MTCHPPKQNFTARGRSARKDREEYLFVCRACGELWQYTDHWYQVGKRRYKTKMVMLTARVPVGLKDELMEHIRKRKMEY